MSLRWMRTASFVVDRKKDMVLRGGENVYCAEVESAIYEVDGIAECIVFGVPDDRLGEEVGSVIVLKSGVEVDPEALRADLLTRIAKHKVPATCGCSGNLCRAMPTASF